MSFHMPLPYGPAPSPDKPMAKAHPSFWGVHSLVISSGWRWGAGNTDENRAGNNRIQANCPRPSENNFVSERSVTWLLDIWFWLFFICWFEWQNSESEEGDGGVALQLPPLTALNAEGEWDCDASCPGGGDTGMQSSCSSKEHCTPLCWRKKQTN